MHTNGTSFSICRQTWLPCAVGLCILGIAMGAPVAVFGSERARYTRDDGYAFYDIVWMEQRADHDCALMLNFNVPQPPAWSAPGERKLAREEKSNKKDNLDLAIDNLLDTVNDPATPGAVGGGMLADYKKERRYSDGRPLGDEAPPEVIYDYSPNALDIPLPEGLKKVDGGRFGKALKFTGARGLKVWLGAKGKRHSMDAWIKPAQIPEDPVCIFASPFENKQGARLFLDPDGHLRLEWANQNTRYNKEIAHGERKTLRSDVPIEAGVWTHVSAYVFRSIHIEIAYRRTDFYEMRIGINGRVSAFTDSSLNSLGAKGADKTDVINPGAFYIGMNPEGKQVFEGLMDDVRVMGPRRYIERIELPFRADAGEDDLFGPPAFKRDSRMFHAGFGAPDDGLFPKGSKGIQLDLGKHADYEDMLAPGVVGKALLIDPAFSFPRIPIQGLSMKEGTFEFWFKPANWDNHTNTHGKSSLLNNHVVNVMRFMGRHKKTKKIVPFMEVRMFSWTIHGDSNWIHPGLWSHFIFSWSPEDVVEEGGWGQTAGDPLPTFRAVRFGSTVWRVQLKRDTSLIAKVEPLYLEIGIDRDWKAYQGQRPAILIDEVIGHDRAFSEEEKKAAHLRWLVERPKRIFEGTQAYVGKPTPSSR